MHANHAREFTPEAFEALARLTRAGVVLLGQSVLLRGVNDSAEALEDLFRAMLRARVKPYYLHQLDPAPGTARFAVPVEEGRALLRTLRGRVTGLGLADLCAGTAGRRRQGAARAGLRRERGVAAPRQPGPARETGRTRLPRPVRRSRYARVSVKRSGGMSLRRSRAICCRASMSRSPMQASPTAPSTRATEAWASPASAAPVRAPEASQNSAIARSETFCMRANQHAAGRVSTGCAACRYAIAAPPDRRRETTMDSKVALVTGAGRGIGLAAARRFLADGWRVALLDIDAGLLAAAMASLAAPDSTLALECDVADAAAVFPAVQRVAQRFGRLDALVNNAGTAVFKPLLETTPEEWNRVLAVNLGGPFLTTQAAAPIMAEGGGGAVVNVTSISGRTDAE